jgi:nucleotide-binding universal stress UspA family protein
MHLTYARESGQAFLVGVDGSEPARHALELAAGIAERFDGTLKLAYVLPHMLLPLDTYGAALEQIEREHRMHADGVLAESLKLIPPGVKRETLVVLGTAAEALATAAKEEQADLVVVGSRSRGPAARLLLGSVADRLVHISTVPVLIAH